MDPKNKNALKDGLKTLSMAANMATAMVGSTFAGVWFGYFLDNRVFNERTHPWLTIIFLFLGIAGGIKGVFTLAQRIKLENQSPPEKDDEK
ncbi:MAG: AtpZ/AtpI family protein [Desulfurivibrionaceae bacterium]